MERPHDEPESRRPERRKRPTFAFDYRSRTSRLSCERTVETEHFTSAVSRGSRLKSLLRLLFLIAAAVWL